MRKKILIILGAVIILVLLLWQRSGSKEAKKIETTNASRKDLVQTVSASGKAKAKESVVLKFQASGLLTWVGVQEGVWVKKGQAIAQLDKRELQKTLDKYLRDYSEQRNDFEEMYRVTYQGHSPDDALTDTVRRILEKSQWDLEKAVLDVELKDIALKFATLISPIEGIITHIDIPLAGVNITPATATFTIANPETMIFEAEIDEIDIGKIKEGQKTTINLDAYSEESFNGEITKINFESVSTSGGGTAFKIEVPLPENIYRRFKIGMNGDVEVIIDRKENVLTVPNGAIHYQQGNPYVNVIKNGKTIIQPVKIGLEGDKETEIIEGLTEDQKVVI